ncbi:tRNA (adenosine(37)-N6)-threonylcarbamoyltransferase complex dimerization subunit type 1 TsaB [Streptomyces angustmyceticus]|uniref:tRNA (Adenosine(37)-N6)-threonylcarbamoyltransferase complex dimerization subunit type 1 TsaB n=1 Tax=Streptomyces angustmyceticus TaxID=285578 RepID=A0A5J4LMW7_9ACTN|nr:tRNA (adenosine(37)-N6)-threonylcarbamoyltransferase complex dimerization subunit type 1 TsaB [Streptomyces angustmyceticus]UAL68604.1 tRNA (adenosine(37)-N6)-threonylcarbamoyltransferase complex dimerization subunit type 1 TsaB [Streptomyces angustmyceticus]GES32819.1 tRNA (adenosine(37)-N6)-threonylcarbamoyltransferase complex dimerization subunit type 1 TsaB [Streptomyces angustmyceticus]
MLLLALDTATPAVTVALHDGTRVLAESRQVDARRHGELLLPAVDRVLAEAGRKLDDVSDIVAGVGPGPYTGLRVGLVTAATFGAVLGVPVHGLCSLDGLAHASGLTGPFVAATDARRKEVYWARYEAGPATSGSAPRLITRLSEPAVDRPADIADQVAGVPAVGAGAVLYDTVFTGLRREAPEHQSAGALAALAVAKLAAGEELPAPQPMYLRRPDAQVPANYKVVTPR